MMDVSEECIGYFAAIMSVRIMRLYRCSQLHL